jgi:hypothetical protein
VTSPSEPTLLELTNAIDGAKQAGVYSPGLPLPERTVDLIALLATLVDEKKPTKVPRWCE